MMSLQLQNWLIVMRRHAHAHTACNMCMHTHVHTLTQYRIRTHVQACTHMHTAAHQCARACTHIHAHTYVHTCIPHTRLSTCMHTHAQTHGTQRHSPLAHRAHGGFPGLEESPWQPQGTGELWSPSPSMSQPSHVPAAPAGPLKCLTFLVRTMGRSILFGG